MKKRNQSDVYRVKEILQGMTYNDLRHIAKCMSLDFSHYDNKKKVIIGLISAWGLLWLIPSQEVSWLWLEATSRTRFP